MPDRHGMVGRLAATPTGIPLIHPDDGTRYLGISGSRMGNSHHQAQHDNDDPNENRHKENIAIVFGRTTVSSLHPG
jgi:hypothetical protein